ncbi:Protein RNA-directed DNA methylation like [Quillaja saponaria]|uniref:Protein RNA-directed DNA methylation like n=1 Tax=Quillaja saponaria TaxID=32244 RepID=A0AAD7LAZ3_QUISA|nr:Protein RNA-directed DNA methylation like [Quillaja saponaria]
MASHLGTFPRVASRSACFPGHPFVLVPQEQGVFIGRKKSTGLRAKVSDGGDSYLDMWKKAVDNERKVTVFQRIVENAAGNDIADGDNGNVEELEKKSEDFNKLLEVSSEERDRIQRMQVIDRAAAAIAAARSILEESKVSKPETGLGDSGTAGDGHLKSESSAGLGNDQEGIQNEGIYVQKSETPGIGIPGPDFWSWTPPADSEKPPEADSGLQTAMKSSVYPTLANPVVEKERSPGFLSIPFESKLSQSDSDPTLPPLQSLIQVENMDATRSKLETPPLEQEQKVGVQFSAHAAEAANALDNVNESLPSGVNPDGSRWWKDTGIEQRPDGVICRWTMTRGVSADQAVEWQEKFWEAADEFGYKELGSEKSGRDATGNVWREYWRESMGQERGLMYIEKTADKWGKSGQGDEWQEKWWEHYDASGQADKWADKWCSIDPNTALEAGHSHVWHERWGEKYDGQGASIKYTDKWAERLEGDGWTKWGDKWDENFDLNGNGVKQGETWWAGKYGESWNRTWGEQHNGSGWIHKYGKSSSGEHWDTHVQQDTWYERFPHFGFYHCFDNSVQLREVGKPSEME